MKKTLAAACLMALTTFGAAQSARAATVAVDVDITLKGFLVLYCYDDIAITITPTHLGTALGTANDTGTAIAKGAVGSGSVTAPSAGNIEADLSIDSETTNVALTTTATLTLKDICGVRAIANNSRNVSVAIGSAATTLVAGTPANGSIAASAHAVSDPTLTLTGGLGTLETFDVTMSLNLAGVIGADTFAAVSGGLPTTEFTITATNP